MSSNKKQKKIGTTTSFSVFGPAGPGAIQIIAPSKKVFLNIFEYKDIINPESPDDCEYIFKDCTFLRDWPRVNPTHKRGDRMPSVTIEMALTAQDSE